jgi:hypothetical protein
VVSIRAQSSHVNLPCTTIDRLHLCSVAFPSEDIQKRAAGLQQQDKKFINSIIGSNHSELLGMLTNTTLHDLDVVVMDAWTANYMAAMPEFKGRVALHQGTFSVGSLVMGVSRPGGQEHPLLPVLQSAMFEVVHGSLLEEHGELVHKWFGQDSGLDLEVYQARVRKALVTTNLWIFISLCCVILIWTAGDTERARGMIGVGMEGKRLANACTCVRWSVCLT